MRWVIPVLAMAVAVIGWGFSYFQSQQVGDLEKKLALAQEDLAQLETFQATEEMYGNHQQVVANFEAATKQLHARRTELSLLNATLADARAEVGELRGKSKEFETLLAQAPERYITITGAKVRAGSSTGTTELAVVRRGVPVSVFAGGDDPAWYKVSLSGFMYHELLKPAP